MKKFIILYTMLLMIINVFAINIYVYEPELFNTSKEAGAIFRELIKEELRKYDGVVVDSIEQSDWQLKIKIIKAEKTRAKCYLNMFENDSLIRTAEGTLNKEDKIDIFISRLVWAMINSEDIKVNSRYGTTIAEEEVLSNIEEPYKTKMEIDMGFHLGTLEAMDAPNYSYWPVYLSGGLIFYKPDYFLLIKGESIFQAIGLRIGWAKILSRNVNTQYYGFDMGISAFYGIVGGNDTYNQSYVGPSVSVFGGAIFSRTSSMFLKPEVRLSFSMRKTSTDIGIIASLNAYLSISF